LVGKYAPRTYGDKVELLAATADNDPNSGKLEIGWKPSAHVIVYPVMDESGCMLRPGSPEYDAAIELAAKRAHDKGLTEATIGTPLDKAELRPAPRRIEYKPQPLPADLTDEEWSLWMEVLGLVKRVAPSDDTSLPGEVAKVIRDALLTHFAEVDSK
jgi:hypothetical protein